MTIDLAAAAAAVTELRARRPLVHNITNYVAMTVSANVLLALGASRGVAINFALASGLLLTTTALAAAAIGLGGSLALTLRARRPPRLAIAGTLG